MENIKKIPSIEVLQKLTDIKEIKALYDAICLEETKVDGELEEILEKNSKIHNELENIQKLPLKIEPIIEDTKSLEDSIKETGNLAESLSKKVREIDRVRERVLLATQKIQDIIDLKKCVEGVQEAMSDREYELAAEYISRYLNIGDESILEQSTIELFEHVQQELKVVVGKELDVGLQKNDHDIILRYSKIYLTLGMRHEAITAFSTYLAHEQEEEMNQIYAECQKHRRQLLDTGAREKLSYAAVLSQLIGRFQRRFKKQRETIEKDFGPDGALRALITLHYLLERQIINFMDLFQKDWQFSETINTIAESNKPKQASIFQDDSQTKKDPRDLSALLDQIGLIAQNIEIHLKYMKILMAKSQENLQTKLSSFTSTNQAKKLDNIDFLKDTASKDLLVILRNSKLNTRMHEILGQAMLLEQYFIQESVKKAIKNEQFYEGSSAFVDEVFFIFKQSAERGKMSHNADSMCAIINLINNTLNDQFKDALFQSSRASKTAQATMIVLNHIEQSADYILKLKEDIEVPATRIFGPVIPVQKSHSSAALTPRAVEQNIQNTQTNDPTLNKIKTCLEDLVETSKKFKNMLQANIEILSSSLHSKMKTLFEPYMAPTLQYVLTEEEFNHHQINDPFFMSNLIPNLETVLQPYQETLSVTLMEMFIQQITRFISETVEQILFTKKFNQLGAEQLDKDLRVLLSYFTKHSKKSVRDKFSRLNQIAYILNFDKVTEILDYWGDKSGQMTWRLTPVEVRRVLSLRVDFDREQIKRLPL